jgi:hypothetical protein
MWGWNPETFEAVGTVAAAFIAVTALLISLRQIATHSAEARQLQARQVGVRLTVARDAKAQVEPGTTYLLSAHNSGRLPITAIRIDLTIRGI